MSRSASVRAAVQDEQDVRRRERRAGVRRAVVRVGGAVTALYTLIAQAHECPGGDLPPPIPHGEQRGELSLLTNATECIDLTARARAYGVERFGNSVVCVTLARGTAGAFLNPTQEVLLKHCASLTDDARAAGLSLAEFYAGKFSVYETLTQWQHLNRPSYGIEASEPLSWSYDTLRRLAHWQRQGEAYALSALVGVFDCEVAALNAEQFIIEELSGATGMLSRNVLPYHPGRRSLRAGHFAVYVQMR